MKKGAIRLEQIVLQDNNFIDARREDTVFARQHRDQQHRPVLVDEPRPLGHDGRADFSNFEQGDAMRAQFLGEDPESTEGASPTLFATDRTDRVTYIAQGWKVTDPQVLADVGPVPDHETLIEIPEDVLKFYAHRYAEEKGTDN